MSCRGDLPIFERESGIFFLGFANLFSQCVFEEEQCSHLRPPAMMPIIQKLSDHGCQKRMLPFR